MGSNYPPGVTGTEPQIVGGDDEAKAVALAKKLTLVDEVPIGMKEVASELAKASPEGLQVAILGVCESGLLPDAVLRRVLELAEVAVGDDDPSVNELAELLAMVLSDIPEEERAKFILDAFDDEHPKALPGDNVRKWWG